MDVLKMHFYDLRYSNTTTMHCILTHSYTSIFRNDDKCLAT